jgi:lipoyl(octanoyl) transferase
LKVLRCLSLGETPYAEGVALQHRIQAAQREGRLGDVLLLLEHRPVVTLGRAAHAAHVLVSQEVLAAHGVELWEADRGGDVTFHGPGQLVGYPLLVLEGAWRDVKKYMRALEEVLICSLRPWGLSGQREPGRPGVWVESRHGGLRKLAAVGAHLSRWHTRHGFALNVATQLEHFEWIVPCGIQGAGVTSMQEELPKAPSRVQVEAVLIEAFCEVFGYTCVERAEGENVLEENALRV